MADILDELRPDRLRAVDGICTPTYEVSEEVLRRAIAEIEHLRFVQGLARSRLNNPNFGDAFRE